MLLIGGNVMLPPFIFWHCCCLLFRHGSWTVWMSQFFVALMLDCYSKLTIWDMQSGVEGLEQNLSERCVKDNMRTEKNTRIIYGSETEMICTINVKLFRITFWLSVMGIEKNMLVFPIHSWEMNRFSPRALKI